MIRTHHFSWRALILGAGFLFLYAPIISLVIYSFNASRLVTIWAGFSLEWYSALLHDHALLQAAWRSFYIAVMAALTAVILGTWAGFVLARMRPFRGSALYAAMLNGPLVVPDVIQGISLLLLLIEISRWFGHSSERGIWMIWIGHVMLCLSYVAIIVQSRLRTLHSAWEEAALDLGATPIRAFFSITLPLISPALISGGLLSFTLSFDDVVFSAFLSGPESTTLPLWVFSRARLGMNPEINALATLFIVVVSLGGILTSRVIRRQEIRHEVHDAILGS
jgi:putrescine transport system permease protein